MINAMMKKIYKTPVVSLETVQATQILAVSFDKSETGADSDVVLTKESKDDWNDIWSE